MKTHMKTCVKRLCLPTGLLFVLARASGEVVVGLGGGGPVPPRLNVEQFGGSDFSLLWPISGPPCVLECATSLAAPAWQPVTNGLGQSGGQNTVTNPSSGNPRFFRLRFAYEALQNLQPMKSEPCKPRLSIHSSKQNNRLHSYENQNPTVPVVLHRVLLAE